MKGPKPGTGNRYDRAEVARIALANPGGMSLAVSEHYGITRKLASSLIYRARKDGHNIPLDYTKPGTAVLYDRAEIAAVAIANPGRMTWTVAARFGVSREHAWSLIDSARKAGHDIPREHARPTILNVGRAEPVDHLNLVCVCGWSCPLLNGGLLLARHTLETHGRVPLRVERIPQDTRKEAA